MDVCLNEGLSIETILSKVIRYVYKNKLEELREENRSLHNEITSGPSNLIPERLSKWILSTNDEAAIFDHSWFTDGRLGPNTVGFNKSNTIGSFSSLDKPLQITSIDNFSTGLANTCVYKGKWQYEVLLCTKGVMQIGWATNNCTFSNEKGVGDTPDSYAYDGNRQRRWNVITNKYGEIWSIGDIISCTIDLNEGKLSYFRNGMSLGEAFNNVKCGPGIAYYPAMSLAIEQSLIMNFGNTQFCYPQPGFLPLMSKQSRACDHAETFLSVFNRHTELSDMWLGDISTWSSFENSNSSVALKLCAQYIGNDLSAYLCQPYIVEKVFLPYMENFAPFEKGVFTPTQNTRKTDIIFSTLLSMLQDEEMMTFMECFVNSLEHWYRTMSNDLVFTNQNFALQILYATLSHEQMRKFCLTNILFENNKFAQFMTIECVDFTILKKNFDINYWSNKNGSYNFGCPASYKAAVNTLQKSVKGLESLQVSILELMMQMDDNTTFISSRFIFLGKLRVFLYAHSIPRRPIVNLISLMTAMNLCERLFEVFCRLWKAETGNAPNENSISPQMFYDGSVSYYDVHRLGGLASHLRTIFRAELASRKKAFEARFSVDSSTSDMDCGPSTDSSHLDKKRDLSLRSLYRLFDCIILLYHTDAHKLIKKTAAQRTFMYENVNLYQHLFAKMQTLPTDLPSPVKKETDNSTSVLTKKLKEQAYQHVWDEVCILNSHSFKTMLDILTLIIGMMQNSSRDGPLFAFIPDFYIETMTHLCHNLKLLVIVAESDSDPVEIQFLGGQPFGDDYDKDYLNLLNKVGEFLCSKFCDSRIVYTDSKEYIIQTLASFVCFKPGLRAIEKMEEERRMEMIKNFLQPYEKGAWAQKNWILVQFWKGTGFGFRFTKSPHLSLKLGPKPANSDINSVMPNSAPCPSPVFLEHVSRYLLNSGNEGTKFVNSLLNQLNWAFSEFIGMLQEIQNASNMPERIFIDSRLLRICATCFDLTLALLRVLEMVVCVAAELFLDTSLESSKSLLCRLCQLVCQVLNRISFSYGCFGHIVNLDIPGLDAIHYYPILTAVAGIIVNLLKKDVVNGDSSQDVTNTLLKEASFQMSSMSALLGIETIQEAKPFTLYAINENKYSLDPGLREEINNASFSFLHYPNHVNGTELQSLVDTINHLQATSLASVQQEKMDTDNLCIICYADLPNAVFHPCNHASCVNCISHYLMNRTDCFYCKTQIQQVVNQDTGVCIFSPATER